MKFESSWRAVVLLALLAPAGAADTLKVPQDFDTIQEAIDAAVAGDEVVVAKGSYPPFSVTGKTDITIRGRGKAVIDGGAVATVVISVDGSSGITLKKLRVVDSADDGIVVSGSTGVTISRCRIEDIANNGILLSGSGHLVQKTRIEDTDSVAIDIADGAADIVLDKNRLTGTDGAIIFRGSGHVATKNRVKDSNDEGFSIVATDCLIEKNRFNGVNDDALDVEGDDNTFIKNRIKKVGSTGVEVDSGDGPFVVTGNHFEKNKVSKADNNGFFVGTAGNTFTRNKAKGSGDFDLHDTAGFGNNTYLDNTFGTQLFQ